MTRFERFDWVAGTTEQIPEIDTQINEFLDDNPDLKVIDFQFSAFQLTDEYGSVPAETVLVEFETKEG